MVDGCRIKLTSQFRFLHEPLPFSSEPHGPGPRRQLDRFVGRAQELDAFVARIAYSEGGSFLITGYRGVGKSTFVNRVIATAGARLRSTDGQVSEHIVPVYLSCARPMRAQELMHLIIRSLHACLIENGIFERLDVGLRSDLELAVARTTLSLAYSRSREESGSFKLGGAPIPGLPGPELSVDLTEARSRRQDASYLAYDDRAAEFDLIRLGARIRRGYVRSSRGILGRLRRRFKGTEDRISIRPVIILDELDKVGTGAGPDGLSPLDEILSGLKSLLTTSGITFLFVGGRDLHDKWQEDLHRGDSIYESVFAHVEYLPILWGGVDDLCDPLLLALDELDAEQSASYSAFKKYLAFQGRGIPRRIIRDFNRYVHWDGDVPHLVFGPLDLRRFRFFAGLQEAVGKHLEEPSALVRHQRDRSDQARLSLLYLIDWIFQQGDREFPIEEAVAAARRLSRLIAPAEEAAAVVVKQLFGLLVRASYLEEVPLDLATQVVGVAVASNQEVVRYRIPHRRLAEIGMLEVEGASAQRTAGGAETKGVPPGRYEMLGTIGEGGMSTVYRALDLQTHNVVAIKVLHEYLSGMVSVRDRFVQEGRTLQRLRHGNIVRMYDVGTEADRPYIAMEYVEGASIAKLIRDGRVRDPGVSISIMRQVLEGLRYCHEQGVIWRDPKPSNVIVTPDGRAVLVDFGIARAETSPSLTAAGAVMGTPIYMSPEQAHGAPLDERSDLYSVGVMLYEMLYGKPPFEGTTSLEITVKHVMEEPTIPEHPNVSPQLRRILRKALAKAQESRFQSAAEMLEALPADADVAAISDIVQRAMEENRRIAFDEGEHTRIFDSPWPAEAPPRPSAPGSGEPPGMHTHVSRPSIEPGMPTNVDANVAGDTLTGESRRVPETAPAVPDSPYLEQALRDGTARRHVVAADVVTLGRSWNNAIQLDVSAASRYHARIVRVDGRRAIEDLNSANGTFVNGEPIGTGRVMLSDGDVITIGGARFVYRDRAVGSITLEPSHRSGA